MIRNTENSWGSVAKFFHWLLFVLLLGMIIFGFLLDYVPEDYKPFAYNTHKLTGLTILVLMVLRGLWAMVNPKPALPFNTPLWQRAAERIVQLAIYATVIAMPIVGLIGSSAAGRAPHLGDFTFQLPVEQNKALTEQMFEYHEWLAFLLIFLVTIHVGAALYHHFIRKDNILRRMLPGRG